MKITITDKGRYKHEIPFMEGDTVRDVIEDEINESDFGLCGGCIACSTCHVYVIKGIYSTMRKSERETLDDLADDIEDNSRLGCCLTLTANNNGDEFIIV
jgi:2Fe-2S ferredoxin